MKYPLGIQALAFLRHPLLSSAAAMVVLLGFAAATTGAQQPPGDSIEIQTRDSGCTVRIIWTDGTDDATHLRVSVNAIERGVVLIDDYVGDQDGNANPLTSFDVDSGSNTINARLYTGPVDEAKLLDEDRETHECNPPATPTATVVPPTATSVPSTATPVVVTATPPPATPDIFCLGGKLETVSAGLIVCVANTATPSSVAPPPLQTAVCPNGSVITVGVGVCPSPATVQVLPAGVSIIRPPSTGDAGLLCAEQGGVYAKDGNVVTCTFPVGNSDNTKVDDQKGSFQSSHPQGYTNPGGSKPPGQQE